MATSSASKQRLRGKFKSSSQELRKFQFCVIILGNPSKPQKHTVINSTLRSVVSGDKDVYIMGDFNIDLLKCESSQISQDFLLSLQSCYLTPTVDKPTRVYRSSATLIVNNPDQLLASGHIISDISDHFSQFCITTSAKDKLQQGMTMQFLYLSKLTNVLPITFFIVSPYQPYCTI